MKASAQYLVVAALTLALGGCLSSGPRQSQRHYVLEAPTAEPAAAKGTRPSTLLVAPTTASSFYDTQDIVFSRSPGTRAYYQYNSWTERPGARIATLLIARIERSAAFAAVAGAGSGVQGGLLLSTQLVDFYHDAAAAPGHAQVTITAELTDPVRRALIARRSFTRSAPAPSFDAPGAVQAFNTATAAVLDDITAWVDGAAPR